MADTMTLEGSRDYLLAMHGGYECVSPEFCDNVYKRMADAIDAAIKQRERDAKDAERLDYLERSYNGIGRLHWGHADDLSGGIRAAIDAAMARGDGR